MTIIAFPRPDQTKQTKELAEQKEPKVDIGAFWCLIRNFASKIGFKAVSLALTLYYLFKEKTTPLWARISIAAGLTYLINPLDLIPDPLIGGFFDDVAVLTGVLYGVRHYVTELITRKAESVAGRYFGGYGGGDELAYA